MADEIKGMKGWGPHAQGQAAADTKADEKKVADAKKDADAKAAKTEKAKEEKKEEHEKGEGHPRLAKQLLDLIERIEERKTPFTDDEQRIMQSAVKRLSRTMGDYRAPDPEA